jgi:murein DD-endopeptidase MepM/ murein hydrolase activator NlpD
MAAPGEGGGGGALYGQTPSKPAKRASQDEGHRFPLAGPFSWGGPEAGFGAKRKGHRHQGYDLAAALGTPVVAPRGGVVEVVGYQGRAAGHYVVLDGDGEDYDYAFMHLRRGSIRVRQGARVAIGQQLGEVGSTGRSTGPHLHFEVWAGGWYTGGEPIDPLPLLQTWSA